jgi:hypothetical protein
MNGPVFPFPAISFTLLPVLLKVKNEVKESARRPAGPASIPCHAMTDIEALFQWFDEIGYKSWLPGTWQSRL